MNSRNKLRATDKPYLRDFFREKRKFLIENKDEKDALDREIQSRLIMSAEYRAADSILIYLARDFEITTKAVVFAALANRKTVAIPRCEDDGTMHFYRIGSLTDVHTGRFGILEPHEECERFTPTEHSLCVCPALCCDMSGRRLGFGAGYYDRYLADFPGKTAALCYADSLIPQIDGDVTDIPMELIVTDSFIRHI